MIKRYLNSIFASMIKKFSTICFVLLSLQVFSQNVETMKSVARFSSDAELTSYINKAKSSGLSLIEVEELVNAQGATVDEIQNFVLYGILTPLILLHQFIFFLIHLAHHLIVGEY